MRNEETLKTVSAEIIKLEGLLSSLTAAFDANAIRATINQKKEALKELRNKLSDIDEQIRYLNSVSSSRAEIDEKEAQLKLRDNEVRRLKNKHNENFQNLFANQNVEGNYKKNLETVHQTLQKECTKLQEDLKKNQNDLTETLINHRNRKAELKVLETEVKELEERVEEHCQSTAYADILQMTKDEVAKLQGDHGELKSLEILNKKYVFLFWAKITHTRY